MDDKKGEARDARLSLRKTNEEVLRKKFQAIAAKKCNEEVVNFGKVILRYRPIHYYIPFLTYYL